MATRLIYQLAHALAEDGRRAVRFDFRGAGRSEGQYDRGRGETADAFAVLEALGGPVTVIGFSFGGAIATRLAVDERVHELICIATPAELRDSDLEPWRDAAAVPCPTHHVYGTADELVGRAEAERLAAGFPRVDWHILDKADHFLTPTHIPRAIATVRAILGSP